MYAVAVFYVNEYIEDKKKNAEEQRRVTDAYGTQFTQ